MDTLKKWKNKNKDLLSENEHDLVFENLINNIDNESIQDTIRLLKSRYKRNQKANIIAIESNIDYNTEFNKITTSLLMVINNLTNEVITFDKKTTETKVKIFDNNILVISNVDSNHLKLKEYFHTFHFTNVDIVTFNNIPESCEKDDIIIFDNRDIYDNKGNVIKEKEDARNKEMLHFIKRTNAHLIHLGNYLKLVNRYRNRIQSENSLITLYSRTKELIEFIDA